MATKEKKNRVWLGVGGLLIALLLAAVFTLGSLSLPFEPHQWTQVLALYAVSTFVVAALLVFGLILTRTALRLWLERRADKLGSRFRTKMVLGAMAVSLLPIVFMFYASYGLLNRTLLKWFPRPLEIATQESQYLLNELGRAEHARLAALAVHTSAEAGVNCAGADASWMVGPADKVRYSFVCRSPGDTNGTGQIQSGQIELQRIRTLSSGAELWRLGQDIFLAARTPKKDGFLLVGRRMPKEFLRAYTEVEKQLQEYEAQRLGYRTYRNQMLLYLLLFTLLVLFAAMWFALFLSKQVTVPIEALAEGTKRVSAGDFDHRVEVHAQDELGTLVGSFNQMTAQLATSRRQIDEFTRNLELAVQELERRRKLLETILENIPTGVVSLSETGDVTRVNPAAVTILGENAREAKTLPELVGEEAARGVQQLMRRSLRLGAASKELEIVQAGRVIHAAVTVSSLGPRRSNPGYVVVVDDLSELLRAQKASAWQEVAQRIAHEIKNPLTPIQLSAQRLLRRIEKEEPVAPEVTSLAPTSNLLSELVGECAALIEREVATLKTLVDEFSQFARFPSARLVASDLNSIVAEALDAFGGRMEGITVRTDLADELPAIKADPELLRRVVVNLIDNAAEALEGATLKEITIATRLGRDGETIEISVTDSGHGISPEDKDRLFLPHFSTKDRGTGLGLAIAGRIIDEHNGTIRVEDNLPVGARFVINLPTAEAGDRV